jgi:tetratricopeptide (TPR) repeat protein
MKDRVLLPLALILLLWLPRAEARAPATQPNIADPNIIRGIEHLYNLEFDRAEELFRRKIVAVPNEPTGYFYLAMVSWSRLAAGFWSPDVIKTYGERIDRAVAVARRVIKKGEPNSYTYFYLGGALGYKGRLLLMQRQYLSSFFLAKDAVKALKMCQKMDPANKDVLYGLGIFDYYTARLSGVLKFLSFLLIHKGDKEEGLRKLHAAASEATYSTIEAKSLLLHIYLFLEAEYQKALPLTREMAQKYWKDPRHLYLVGVVYLKLNKIEEYEGVLNDFYHRARTLMSSQEAMIWQNRGSYLEASYCLFQGRYDQARSLLETIHEKTDAQVDPSMVAWPLLKLGMIHDLEGAREQALECYRQIMELQNGAGAQFLAERYTRRPAVANDPFLGY